VKKAKLKSDIRFLFFFKPKKPKFGLFFRFFKAMSNSPGLEPGTAYIFSSLISKTMIQTTFIGNPATKYSVRTQSKVHLPHPTIPDISRQQVAKSVAYWPSQLLAASIATVSGDDSL